MIFPNSKTKILFFDFSCDEIEKMVQRGDFLDVSFQSIIDFLENSGQCICISILCRKNSSNVIKLIEILQKKLLLAGKYCYFSISSSPQLCAKSLSNITKVLEQNSKEQISRNLLLSKKKRDGSFSTHIYNILSRLPIINRDSNEIIRLKSIGSLVDIVHSGQEEFKRVFQENGSCKSVLVMLEANLDNPQDSAIRAQHMQDYFENDYYLE